MPIILVAAIAVGAGLLGYMFGKSTKEKELKIDNLARGKNLETPPLTRPVSPEIKAAAGAAKKEEVKAVAKAVLNDVLEGRTVKSKEGRLLVIRRGSAEGKWNFVDPTDATNVVLKDMSAEDIKAVIDDGQFTLT